MYECTYTINRKDLGWPLTAMLRYRSFLDSWHLLAHAHYIFSIDVDCLFVAPVGREILAHTVATVHADNAYYDGTNFLKCDLNTIFTVCNSPDL